MAGKSFGLLLILAGVLMILERLNLIALGSLVRNYWPLLIVAYGLGDLIREKKLSYYNGFIILIGLFLQLDRIYLIGIDVWSLFFPVILVFIGIMQIKNRR